VNLVVDTHPLVWHLTGQTSRLSRRARQAFTAAESGRWTLRVPVIVLYEIVLLERSGRIKGSYRDLRDQLAAHPGFPIEPLLPDDIDEARSLADLADPYDRLIAGTATRLGLPLLTRDEALTAARGIPTIW
jgi:PIN domain nuclease of toxin-antitoxin system